MCDKGLLFEWYDKYCENLFSKTFMKSKTRYDAIMAFEVFEHLPHPITDLEEMV